MSWYANFYSVSAAIRALLCFAVSSQSFEQHDSNSQLADGARSCGKLT